MNMLGHSIFITQDVTTKWVMKRVTEINTLTLVTFSLFLNTLYPVLSKAKYVSKPPMVQDTVRVGKKEIDNSRYLAYAPLEEQLGNEKCSIGKNGITTFQTSIK